MKAQILKKMTSLGQTLEVGDIVDVADWRHTKSLVNSRYIKLIEEEAKKVAKPKVEAIEEIKPKKVTKKEKVEE